MMATTTMTTTTTTTAVATLEVDVTSIPTSMSTPLSTPTPLGEPTPPSTPTATIDLPITPVELHRKELCCVICFKSFLHYPISNVNWEAEVTKHFYLALKIPEDDNAVGGLPFCPECHSKVCIMFSVHQQIQNLLQNFNCQRNELAFKVVSSINLGQGQDQQNWTRSGGPLDLIQQQIFNGWKDLYEESKAKRVQPGDVYDPATKMEYLMPRLSVADEFPIDPTAMNISEDAKQRLTSFRKTPASFNKFNINGKETSKAEVINMGMPKLELESVSKSKSTEEPQQSRRVAFAQSRLGREKVTSEHGQLNHKAAAISKTFKPQSGAVTRSSKFNLDNHFVRNSSYRKRAPKRLANGLWKCNFCPRTYNSSSRASQHESRAHPETRPFLCAICSMGFLTLDGVRKHLLAAHQDIVKRNVKCPLCPRIFSQQSDFQQHFSAVHNDKGPGFTLQLASKKQQKIKKKVKVAPASLVTVASRPVPSPPSPEITDMKRRSTVKQNSSRERARTSESKTGKPGTILGKRSSRRETRSLNLSTLAKEEEKEAQEIPSMNGRISLHDKTETDDANDEKEKESKSEIEVTNGKDLDLTDDVKVEKLVEELKTDLVEVEVESKQEDVQEGLPAKRLRSTSTSPPPPPKQEIPSMIGRISPLVKTETEDGNAERENESKSGIEATNGRDLSEDVKVEKLVKKLKADLVNVEFKQEDVEDGDGLPAKRLRSTSAAAKSSPTATNRRRPMRQKEVLVCPICGKTFIGRRGMAGHGKMHRGNLNNGPIVTKSEHENGDIVAETESKTENDPLDTTPKTLKPLTDTVALTSIDMTATFSKLKKHFWDEGDTE